LTKKLVSKVTWEKRMEIGVLTPLQLCKLACSC
jgi:hypothetical protein